MKASGATAEDRLRTGGEMSVRDGFEKWLGQVATDWPDDVLRRVREALDIVDEIASTPGVSEFDQLGDWARRAMAATATPHDA